MSDRPHFLKLSVNEEHRKFSIRCNRMVKHLPDAGNSLHLVSGAGTATAVKALKATLQAKQPSLLWLANVPDPKKPGRELGELAVLADGSGFHVHLHRLGLDQWHILAWTKADWFLPSDSMDHLWAMLKGDRYTTPLLRHWMAPLWKRFYTKGHLRPLHCYRAKAWMLLLPEAKLDELVAEGVACGELTLEDK